MSTLPVRCLPPWPVAVGDLVCPGTDSKTYLVVDLDNYGMVVIARRGSTGKVFESTVSAYKLEIVKKGR